MAEQLVCLTYVSRWTFADPALCDWETLQQRWDTSNAANSLSSVLWVTQQAAFQVLEGPEAAVDRTFARIRVDGRHTQVSLLARTTAHSRQHPQGLRVERLDCEPHLRVPQRLLDLLAGHYTVLLRFCPAAVQERRLKEDPDTQRPRAVRQPLVAVRLLAFDEITAAAPRRRPPAQVSSDLTRLLNLFTNAVAEGAAQHGGRVWGLRGATAYVTFPPGAEAAAVEGAGAIVSRLDDNRNLALRRDIGSVLFGAAAVVSASSVVGPVSLPNDKVQEAMIGGGITLGHWVLESCGALGYSVLLTEAVQQALPKAMADTLRPCGAHHLGRNVQGDPTAEAQTRLYTPHDRSPFLIPQTITRDIENFWLSQESGADSVKNGKASKSSLQGAGARQSFQKTLPASLSPNTDSLQSAILDGATDSVPLSSVLPRVASPKAGPSSVFSGSSPRGRSPPPGRTPPQFDATMMLRERVGFPTEQTELRTLWEELGGREGGYVQLSDLQALYGSYPPLDGADLLTATHLHRRPFNLHNGNELTYDAFCVLMLRLARL